MEIKNNENKNIPLRFNRNRSTGDLMEKETSYKNNYIPDYRMEQYLNEYYNYFYSTKDSEKENNSNIDISTNKNKSNNLSNITNSKTYSIILSKNDTKKFNNFSTNNTTLNLPDDLLIEYNNRKRLEELRKKYLSSSSLRFLRKKDEIKISNNTKEENKQEEKIDKKENINDNNVNKENNQENDLKNVILDLKLKYDKLQKAFNILSENKNKNKEDDINHNINKKGKDVYNIYKDTYKNMYKDYLIEENNDLKNINNNYEIILEMLISYINQINKIYFNFDQIEYFNLKQNIYNKKTKCIGEVSDFLKKCKENLENNNKKEDVKSNKIKFKEKNIISYFNNMNKRDPKNINKNKMRYTNSTQSFRNKYSSDSNYSREKCRNKTINKTRNDKIKKTRINLVKNKNKK